MIAQLLRLSLLVYVIFSLEVLETKISHHNDDGYAKDGKFIIDEVYVNMDPGNFAAFRFPLYLHSNSTVEESYISLTFNHGFKQNYFLIYFQNSADSNSLNDKIETRPKLQEIKFWRNRKQNRRYGDVINTPDLSSFIREIIKKPEWKSGNHITVFIQNVLLWNKNQISVVSFEGALAHSYNGPKLIIKGNNLSQKTQTNQNFIKRDSLLECPSPLPPSSNKIPVILVIDDLQFHYIEHISTQVVNKTRELGIDVLVNVIPNKIDTSMFLGVQLKEWYQNNQCQIQIAAHGFTHQNSEYQMNFLSTEHQRSIIESGMITLRNLGISTRSFTPSGGQQTDQTLKILGELGFHTSIDWWLNLPSNHGVTMIRTLRMCDLSIGSESGRNCIFKEVSRMMKEFESISLLKGYVCVGLHVQDFLNPQNFQKYIKILQAIKNDERYESMTGEEFHNWKKANQ